MQAVLMSKMGRFAAAASFFIPRTAHNYRKGNPSSVANALLFRTQFSTNPNPPDAVATTNPTQLLRLCWEKSRKGFDKLDDALGLFHQLARAQPLPSLDHFNLLLTAVAQMNEYSAVLSLYEEIRELGIPTDESTSFVLTNCLRGVLVRLVVKQEFGEAVEVLRLMQDQGMVPDVALYGVVVNGLCKAGKIEDARKLFSTVLAEGLKPNVEMYNYMVSGLCKGDLLDEALELLVQMEKDGCPPDAVTCNIILRAFLEKGVRHKVQMLLQEMMKCSFSPDARTMSMLVDSLDWLTADGEGLK